MSLSLGAVRLVPLGSLLMALFMMGVAWRRRSDFARRPYMHWFIYLHLAAVGLHQFEEYGWPGGFYEAFTQLTGVAGMTRTWSRATLEMLNLLVLAPLFAVLGWIGTRVKWIGLAVLFTSFANGFFHLISSITRLHYVPGAATGTLLYLPLGLLAAEYAIRRGDVGRRALLLAFFLGVAASFLPFAHARAWRQASVEGEPTSRGAKLEPSGGTPAPCLQRRDQGPEELPRAGVLWPRARGGMIPHPDCGWHRAPHECPTRDPERPT